MKGCGETCLIVHFDCTTDFYFLEACGFLVPDDQLDLYSLHYVYIPRINRSLSQFEECWNHHGIRTANSKSPHQLFTMGALQLQRSGLRALDFFSSIAEHYGIEEVGLPPEADDEVTYSEIVRRHSSLKLRNHSLFDRSTKIGTHVDNHIRNKIE